MSLNTPGPSTLLSSAEIYDPDTGTFAPTTDMAHVVGPNESLQMPDGRVLVYATGPEPFAAPTKSRDPVALDVYDPATGTFAEAGTISRAFDAANVLPDGGILLSGAGHYTERQDDPGWWLLPVRPLPAVGRDPQVSPDGTTVVFVRAVGDTTGALFTVPAAGGTLTRLTPDAGHVGYPRWSPDGKTNLFSQDSGASANMWTVPATGGTPKALFTLAANEAKWEGDWSPDSSKIVFKVYEVGSTNNELDVASADGSNERTLWVGDNSTAETPDWGR